MATATLELVNPYSKLGLKRRPTYNEIINLIDENETITGNLTDRTATFYKASPEGSFFDGTDAMELLKEQQNRIFQRQMQDLLLRQNVRTNGGTFNLQRHLQSANTTEAQPAEVQPDRDMLSAQVQADLQRRQQQLQDRQQQTGQATQTFLQRTTSLPVIGGMLSSLRSGARSVGGTPSGTQHFDLPSNDPPEVISSATSEGEMLTARTNPEDVIKNALQSKRPEADEGLINSVSQVLVKYSQFTPEQIVRDFNSFNILNQIYRALHRSGFISADVLDKYQDITNRITQEGGGRKRANLLRELAEHYKRNVYDEYISREVSRGSGERREASQA